MDAESTHDHEHYVFMANAAEQAERYDEMCEYMTMVAKMNKELTVEERNLLSVAFKNKIGNCRAAYRVISSINSKEEQKQNFTHIQTCKGYHEPVSCIVYR